MDPLELVRTTYLGTPHLQRARTSRIAYIVVHDAEVFSTEWDDPTAELIGRWFRNEASRGSAHAATDSNTTQRFLLDGRAAAGAPPLNDSGWHLEQEGRASWPVERWRRRDVILSLRRSAWIASRVARKYRIPIKWLGVEDLRRAGKNPSRPQGFVDHATVSKAFGQSDHWDPGPGFPRIQWIRWVAWYSRWHRELAAGVTGADVLAWKGRLHKLGLRGFTVLFPGYGKGIEKATRAFQLSRKLPATGIVDPDTWAQAA